MKTKIISAIISVYNEEKTVAGIIKGFLGSELVSEVICVNDGSTDKTLEILKSFGSKIRLISFKRNHGKGFAMAAGTRKAKGEILIFFDGDLLNFSPKHIKDLLEPVVAGSAKVTIGIPVAKKLPSYYRKWVYYISGMRVYHKDMLLPHLPKMAKTGYGVEIYLNSVFKLKEAKFIPLIGLVHIPKEKKWKLTHAIKKYLDAGAEISWELGKKEIISPADYKKIKEIAKGKILAEFAPMAKEIKKEDLKKLLENYIFRYLQHYLKITWQELKKPIELQDAVFKRSGNKRK